VSEWSVPNLGVNIPFDTNLSIRSVIRMFGFVRAAGRIFFVYGFGVYYNTVESKMGNPSLLHYYAV
jgi:hypothetical protein